MSSKQFHKFAVLNLCFAVIKALHIFLLYIFREITLIIIITLPFLDLLIVIIIIIISNVIIISRLSIAALYNHHGAVGLRAHPVLHVIWALISVTYQFANNVK
jgi:hypothetical protein